MYNFLLDSLPEDYEGYLLRTDYRVGIQISQALEDDELSPQERLAVAFSLLYGNGTPPAEIAYQGLQWFLNGGNLPEQEEGQEDSGEEDPGIRFFSFDYDAARLYSGFLLCWETWANVPSHRWCITAPLTPPKWTRKPAVPT